MLLSNIKIIESTHALPFHAFFKIRGNKTKLLEFILTYKSLLCTQSISISLTVDNICGLISAYVPTIVLNSLLLIKNYE